MSSIFTSTSHLFSGLTKAFWFHRPVGTLVFEAMLLSVNGFKSCWTQAGEHMLR